MPDDASIARSTSESHRTGDTELLRRYAATGAEDAFTELIRRHIDGVYSAALRRVGGDVHLAQDVTQRVFVALVHKAAALATHPFLAAWLHTSTRHEAANAVRAERRRKAREHHAHAMTAVMDEHRRDATDWERIAPLLDAAIDQLAEQERVAIVLRFVDRRRFADIALALHTSEDAARMRVNRALDTLQSLLAKRGITSTAGALAVALANQAVTAAPVGLAASIIAAAFADVSTVSAGVGAFTTFFQAMKSSKLAIGIAASVATIAGVVCSYAFLNKDSAASGSPVARIAEFRATLPSSELPAAAKMSRRPDSTSSTTAQLKPGGDDLDRQVKELAAPGNTFFDPEYKITGRYPEGWSVRYSGRWGDKENNVRFVDPERPDVWPTLYYRINEQPRTLSAAEIQQWLRGEAEKKAESRRRSGLNEYANGDLVFHDIGDRPAVKWTATFAFHGTNPKSTTPRGDDLQEYLTLIYSPNCTALYFLQATKSDLAAMRPKFEKMIATTILP